MNKPKDDFAAASKPLGCVSLGQIAYTAWHTGPNGEHEEGWMPWEKAPWQSRWERCALAATENAAAPREAARPDETKTLSAAARALILAEIERLDRQAGVQT